MDRARDAAESLPQQRAAANTKADRTNVRRQFGQLPLGFEANLGQVDPGVRFTARGPGYNLSLGANEAVLSLRKPPRPDNRAARAGATHAPDVRESTAVRISFVGSQHDPVVEGQSPQPGKSHYLIGNDPSRWHRNVPRYGRVRYDDVYPGIDAVYYGSNQQQLEYDFVVSPHADPSRIKVRFDGVEGMRLDDAGNLLLETAQGILVQQRPLVYQQAGDQRRTVASRYALLGANQVGFQLGTYDRSMPLTIDPVLVYGTYLGGSSAGETGTDIAVDNTGNIFVTGVTYSLDFPKAGTSFQTGNAGGSDVFVTKLNETGSALVYSVYIGGQYDDRAEAIALDDNSNAYVTGYSRSGNFPTTTGAPQRNKVSGADAFVLKLNNAGSSLVYSTFLGGDGDDFAHDLAVDSNGTAYIAGSTDSTNFPVAAPLGVSPLQSSNQDGGNPSYYGDGFVTKLNNAGTAWTFSTYLGGAEEDLVQGIAVDDYDGNVYVTGSTTSPDFPTLGSLRPHNNGYSVPSVSFRDAFITKLKPNGASLVYGTFIGGQGEDFGFALALDANRNVYITGNTNSDDFPLVNARQATRGSSLSTYDAFVTKLNAAGTSLAYSTFHGGSQFEYGSAIAVDAYGNAYVAGATSSPDFPVVDAFQAQYAGSGRESWDYTEGDAFVSKFDAAGNQLIFSTYLGGSGLDQAEGLARVGEEVLVTGMTTSANFPTSGGSYDTSYNSPDLADVFISRIGPSANVSPPTLSIANVSVTEGNSGTKTATFTITLSKTSPNPITYNIATSNGTATAGSDYVARSLSGETIAAGQTSRTFAVTINGDGTVEPNETFNVNLTGISGATMKTAQAVGTIVNDDSPVLTIADVSVSEGNAGTTTNAVFTVKLSKASTSPVTFNIATADATAQAGSDYVAKSASAQTIAAGQTTASFSVEVTGDGVVESTETFKVLASSIVGADIGDAEAIGTIVNDDSAALSIADVSITEGDAGTKSAVFTVQLSKPSNASVTYTLATSNGTAASGSDYVANGPVQQTIAAGQTSKTFAITINGDDIVEANETFLVTASSVSGATVADGQATGTIVNDDQPVLLSIADVSVTEGNAGTKSAVFTVQLSRPSSAPVTYTLATSDGTASSASDYVASGSVQQTIAAGQTSKTFSVSIRGDGTVEANETFKLTASNVSGATASDGQALGTILNDDVAILDIGDVAVSEGNSSSKVVTFTVTLSQPAVTAVTYDIATAAGTAISTAGVGGDDYVHKAATTETIPAGTTSRVFQVRVNGDTTVEPTETFTVSLSNAAGAQIGDGQAIGTISNDDATAISIADVTAAENGSNAPAIFTAKLSNPSVTPVTFAFATSGGTATAGLDYTSVNYPQVTIAAGQTSAVLTVPVLADGEVENPETFFATLSSVNGASVADAQAKATILNIDVSDLSIADISIVEGNAGNSIATFTVQLSKPTPWAVTYNISTADGTAIAGSDYLAASATTQSIPAGQTSKTFQVTVVGDVTFEQSESFLVNVTTVGGASVADGQAVGTISPDDSKPSLKINAVAFAEGNSGTKTVEFTVQLSNPSDADISYDIHTSDVSTNAADYVAKSLTGEVIPAGQTSRQFIVEVKGDTAQEANERFYVDVFNVRGATAAAVDASALGTILNDDTTLSVANISITEGNSGTTEATLTIQLSAALGYPLTFRISPASGSARGGFDYVAQDQTLQTIAAGQTSATYSFAIIGDRYVEGAETLTIHLWNIDDSSHYTTQVTIVDDDTVGSLIRTFAGGSTASDCWQDGLPALSTCLIEPRALEVAPDGSVYFAESNRVRKVGTDGRVWVVAGTNAGFSGDGGPAINALLRNPSDLAFDGAGNLYIADSNNYRVRKVSPGGTIVTVVGNGSYTHSGDGGAATAAGIFPNGIAVNAQGELFISDGQNHRVRKVDKNGVIQTVAGTGSSVNSGDGGLAAAAGVAYPIALAFDSAGNLYIGCAYDAGIRKVTPTGIISTVVAGITPQDLEVDALGNLYASQGGTASSTIRKISPAGVVSTITSGAGGFAGDGGPVGLARLSGPTGLAVDPTGRLYVADRYNNRIRTFRLTNLLSDLDGDGFADIFWRNTATGFNELWKSAVTVTSAAALDTSWAMTGVGDFNGDGLADVLWRDGISGDNLIWWNGDPATSQSIASVPDLAWEVAGIGDFDGDGQSDIVWRNDGTGATTLWRSALALGMRSLPRGASEQPVDLAWGIAGVGDFNHDGRSDLLWRHATTGDNVIWLSGDWRTQLPVATLATQWIVAGIGDLDRDGQSDIVWRNGSTGANMIWASAQSTLQLSLTAVTDMAWRIVGTTDYNGDGLSDILWRNTSTGANTIWKSGNSAAQQSVASMAAPAWITTTGR